MYIVFLPNIKQFRYKIRTQFNNSALAVEKNNHLTKAVKVYIACGLDYCPSNLVLKNCLFGATNIVKGSDKSLFIEAMD